MQMKPGKSAVLLLFQMTITTIQNAVLVRHYICLSIYCVINRRVDGEAGAKLFQIL